MDQLNGVGDLVGLTSQVPPLDHFPGVDELNERFDALAEEFPELITRSRIGTSRLGEPLWCYTVGAGTQDYLIVGGVHPNEPIGFWTALHLARTLCADEVLRGRFDGAWHIVGTIDPDGARLNEGWFDGPFDRGHYGRHFYRPEPDQQVEWTFPFEYKRAYFDRVMPETVAFMRLIDKTKPALLSTLHNGEFGGVYYYLGRAMPELYPALKQIPFEVGLPLDLGEPEASYAPVYDTAIFGTLDMVTSYDYLESIGADPMAIMAGESSGSYSKQYGTQLLVTEVPYWVHPDSSDTTPIGESYADVLREQAKRMRETGTLLVEIMDELRDDLTIVTPFLTGSRVFVPMLVDNASVGELRAAAPEADRPATKAERFSCLDLVHCFRLRFGGMLLRALDAQVVAGKASVAVHRRHRELLAVYDAWVAEAAEESPGAIIPIEHLVGIQYAAILATAALLQPGVTATPEPGR